MPAGCGREPDSVAVAMPERGLATAGARWGHCVAWKVAYGVDRRNERRTVMDGRRMRNVDDDYMVESVRYLYRFRPSSPLLIGPRDSF